MAAVACCYQLQNAKPIRQPPRGRCRVLLAVTEREAYTAATPWPLSRVVSSYRTRSLYGSHPVAIGVAQSSIADIRLKRNKGANISLIYAISVGLGIDLTEFFNSEFFKAENITD